MEDLPEWYYQYERWIKKSYSNPTTSKKYPQTVRCFISKHKESDIGGKKFNQKILDLFLIYIQVKNINPYWRGVAKSLYEAFRKDGLQLELPKERSRSLTQSFGDVDYLDKDDVDNLRNNSISPIIKTAAWVLADTGLRINEYLKTNLSKHQTAEEKKEIGIKKIDYENRHLMGLGKGATEFDLVASKEAFEIIKLYITTYAVNPEKPFMLFKDNGKPYKNQEEKFYRLLQKECKYLNITLPSGNKIKPHLFRHHLGHHLINKGFTVPEVQRALRHKDIKVTARYTSAPSELVNKRLEDEVFNS